MFSIKRFLEPIHVVQPPALFIAVGVTSPLLVSILSSIAVTLITPLVAPICGGDDPMVRR